MFNRDVDLLLTSGLVFDGTGAPGRVRDVGVRDGRLVLDPGADAIGTAAEVRDISGLAISPGFVDIHTHSDLTLLSNPLGDSKIRQGVTTEVVGNCGLGVIPLPPLPDSRDDAGADDARASAGAGVGAGAGVDGGRVDGAGGDDAGSADVGSGDAGGTVSAEGSPGAVRRRRARYDAAAPQPGADRAGIRAAVGYLDLDPTIAWNWGDQAGYLDALRAARPALNVAALAPHLPLHAAVVGLDDTPATPAQIARMADLLQAAFAQGAVGVSTGLVYAPLCYVAEDELIAIGEVAARWGGVFAWHVRDYADDLIPSVEQVIRVARATGCRVQISHLQVVGRRNWGAVQDVLALVEQAIADGFDVGVDMYPYLAGNCPLSQLLPDWAQRGGSAVFAPRLREPQVRAEVREAWLADDRDWNDIVVNGVSGDGELGSVGGRPVVGRRIAELAQVLGADPADVALDLLAEHGSAVTIIAYGRSEDDLLAVLAHPATVVASDGQALDPHGVTGAAGSPHPRSYGCFPRYLARYATDLADGIRRCTSAPAARVGLADRGRLADGFAADLVVFDPDRLGDAATFADPQQFATGIELVIVGGQVVIDHGVDTGARPGQVLTGVGTVADPHPEPAAPPAEPDPAPPSPAATDNTDGRHSR